MCWFFFPVWQGIFPSLKSSNFIKMCVWVDHSKSVFLFSGLQCAFTFYRFWYFLFLKSFLIISLNIYFVLLVCVSYLPTPIFYHFHAKSPLTLYLHFTLFAASVTSSYRPYSTSPISSILCVASSQIFVVTIVHTVPSPQQTSSSSAVLKFLLWLLIFLLCALL